MYHCHVCPLCAYVLYYQSYFPKPQYLEIRNASTMKVLCNSIAAYRKYNKRCLRWLEHMLQWPEKTFLKHPGNRNRHSNCSLHSSERDLDLIETWPKCEVVGYVAKLLVTLLISEYKGIRLFKLDRLLVGYCPCMWVIHWNCLKK